MRRTFVSGVLAAGLLFFTGCDFEDMVQAGRATHTEDFHYSYPLKAGGRLSLETFNGSVEISAWEQETVDISGSKYASTPELRDAIKIDVSAAPDSVIIRTIRPSERRGNMGARFVIKVPRKVQLDRIASSNGSIRTGGLEGPARLKTSNGPVRVDDLRGSLDIQTSNGSVTVHNHDGSVTVRTSNGPVRVEGVRGSFEATTSNGPIHAEVVKADPARSIKLETSNGGIDLRLQTPADVRAATSNGGITLHLPENAGARLIASTSNSSIKTEFDVQTRGPVSKRRIDGVIGAGGPTLDLTTSNGSIRVLRQ